MDMPSAKLACKWILKAYILWSVCADVALICGVVFLIWGTTL